MELIALLKSLSHVHSFTNVNLFGFCANLAYVDFANSLKTLTKSVKLFFARDGLSYKVVEEIITKIGSCKLFALKLKNPI